MGGAQKKRRQDKGHGGAGGASSKPPPGGLDGPASQPSQSPSDHGLAPALHPSGDPARDPVEKAKLTDINRRLDLPGMAYNLDRMYDMPTELMARPKNGNTTGKEVTIDVNSFNVLQYPTKTVFQYDVQVGSGKEKRGLIKKIWNSAAVKAKLFTPGSGWIFDGNKIAWSLRQLPNETTIQVDLDAEDKITPRAGRENKHRVTVRKTNAVNLVAVDSYLRGQMSFDTTVLEAINFLDHLMRQFPSENYTQIKRSFFARGEARFNLGKGIEAFKGVYQSIRACQGGRLGVNVDVANGTFWTESIMTTTACNLTNSNNPHDLSTKCEKVLRDKVNPNLGLEESPTFKQLRRLRKVGFYAKHRGSAEKHKTWIIDRFLNEGARQHVFKVKNKQTGKDEELTIEGYFKRRYNITLEYPHLPLVQTTKKGVIFPMECCVIAENQRYPFKLDEFQTANMIKFAVSRPKERLAAINHGLGMLKWAEDPMFQEYGLKISGNMTQTKARVLPNPQIQFGGSTHNPGISGRWDLKGKKFLAPNIVPLQAWGVAVFNTSRRITLDKPQLDNFIREFVKVYQGHGGIVKTTNPAVIIAPADPAQAVEALFNETGNRFNMRPQMLVFMVPDKAAFHYARIKKSADCRYGIPSQVMQIQQVQKINAQYMSNVCMKFNAKLGGTTARVVHKSPTGHFKVPSIIIGADVSHASPGAEQPSMAAITMSMDKFGGRYAAACETNGFRVEIITTTNVENMVMPLLIHWAKTVGGGNLPQHIYYFRDGVSEGQYQHVLQQEVRDMRNVFKRWNPKWEPKFIVVVASKRHHIRFFPKAGTPAADKNSNPVPGTLVEKDITHPFEYDFYLNSHSAIQGTARPVHYHVLMDEAKLPPNEFQNMIYEQCYQYMRSTTPVSLHPAVYYAHLASNRARSHENVPASSGPRTGPPPKPKSPEKSATDPEKPPTESVPLLQIENTLHLREGMWYI
ncbi:MAG: hypothetical protein M1812_000238 [Candelaria pacifica]|nr:MAG: hypothetical protein M1812_000238 [Candelaria pacifica]